MSDDEPIRPRRDFLVTAAMATTGVGTALALWPFFASMGPAADIKARRLIFDIGDLKGGNPSYVATNLAPLMVFRRTQDELASLREGRTPIGKKFRDRNSSESSQPEAARNWHRSLKPEIMVCNARCTREGCVVSRAGSRFSEVSYISDDLQCPCCGSRYDLAGRANNGPAPGNLTVPLHRYLNATQIEFGDDMQPAWKISEPAPANPPRWRRT